MKKLWRKLKCLFGLALKEEAVSDTPMSENEANEMGWYLMAKEGPCPGCVSCSQKDGCTVLMQHWERKLSAGDFKMSPLKSPEDYWSGE
jgi:hypothetical protein